MKQFNSEHTPNENTQNTQNTPYETDMHRRPRRFPLVAVALIFVALGIGILIGGVAMGGRGGTFTWADGLRFTTGANTRGTTTHEITGEVTSLIVDATATAVHVQHDPSRTTPMLRYRDTEVTFTHTDGTLTVTQAARRGVNVSWGFNNRPRITIYLPTRYLDSLSVQGTSGSIRIENITATYSVRAAVASGSVRIENVSSPRITLSATSGSVRADNSMWQYMDVRASSGSVRLTNGRIFEGIGSTYATTTSGSTRVEMLGNRADFSFDVSATSGSVRAVGGRGTGRNPRITGETGPHMITVRTTSGSARLEIN